MSRGDSGVAYIVWNVRCQLSPPMIGNVASNAADCIDVATSSPGARNWRYDTPPSAAVDDALTYPPRPIPIAVRNSSGVRNDVNTDERNVRRYWTARCSMTWVTPATRLLDERAAGEPQEDVLERRPPDKDRLGLESPLVGRDRDG